MNLVKRTKFNSGECREEGKTYDEFLEEIDSGDLDGGREDHDELGSCFAGHFLLQDQFLDQFHSWAGTTHGNGIQKQGPKIRVSNMQVMGN